jgi:hypothetical protein
MSRITVSDSISSVLEKSLGLNGEEEKPLTLEQSLLGTLQELDSTSIPTKSAAAIFLEEKRLIKEKRESQPLEEFISIKPKQTSLADQALFDAITSTTNETPTYWKSGAGVNTAKASNSILAQKSQETSSKWGLSIKDKRLRKQKGEDYKDRAANKLNSKSHRKMRLNEIKNNIY